MRSIRDIPKGIGVLAAGGRVAAAQRAVRDMVTDGTGAVLPCPWDACPHIAWWTARIAENLTPAGYRLVLERPLEGELVRWGVVRQTTFVDEHVGHVVIGRESAAPRPLCDAVAANGVRCTDNLPGVEQPSDAEGVCGYCGGAVIQPDNGLVYLVVS